MTSVGSVPTGAATGTAPAPLSTCGSAGWSFSATTGRPFPTVTRGGEEDTVGAPDCSAPDGTLESD